MNNPYGFDFEHLRVTRLWSHNGASAVRVLNLVTGLYVDVQTTPKGRKQYVTADHLDPDALRRERESAA